jgi:hypothetical protein
MSSIMRRRRGLISAIGGSRLEGWASTPTILSDGTHSLAAHPIPATAGSFNPLRESRSGGLGMSPQAGNVFAASDLDCERSADAHQADQQSRSPIAVKRKGVRDLGANRLLSVSRRVRRCAGSLREPIDPEMVGRSDWSIYMTPLAGHERRRIHGMLRGGVSGFGGGRRRSSTSRMPSSETQATSQNASI